MEAKIVNFIHQLSRTLARTVSPEDMRQVAEVLQASADELTFRQQDGEGNSRDERMIDLLEHAFEKLVDAAEEAEAEAEVVG